MEKNCEEPQAGQGTLKSATKCELYDSHTRRKLLFLIYFANPNFIIQLNDTFLNLAVEIIASYTFVFFIEK